MNKYFYMIIALLFIYALTQSRANKLVNWFGNELKKSYKLLFEGGL